MDVELTFPTAGLEDPNGIAQAQLEGTTVTLPEGMAVNPASAQGQGACTLEQLGMSAQGVPNDDPVTCPDASKLGTVEAITPILPGTFNGTVYLAKQGSNPFGSLLALYLVIDSPEKGILIKLAGKVSPDPVTGQLTVSFDGNPQAPLSSVRLRFPGGPRAALINPPSCGPHTVHTQMTPWTAADPAHPTDAETVELASSFNVTQGPNGTPCPSGALEPRLRVGATNPTAGATTPFVLDLSREDGTQRFRAITTTMPPGLTAYLKGVPYCPEAALASIPTGPNTGAAQITSPACPAASQVGTVIAGAGAGPDPLFLDTGKVYLAGPYKGAPLSLAIATPAVAGPFDLGNVVVRAALNIDPATAQVSAVSDPIPTILRASCSTSGRSASTSTAPTSPSTRPTANRLRSTATVTGEKGSTATVSDRFQVGGCDKLGFKPNLKLKLKGGTKRGAYPRSPPPSPRGPATPTSNAPRSPCRTRCSWPRSTSSTICTRVQFAADACPKGSIYGKATATSPAGRLSPRGHRLPARLLQPAARHGDRPQGPRPPADRDRAGRKDRLQERRHPQHLRPRPRRPGDQVHPEAAGRQEEPARQLPQPLQGHPARHREARRPERPGAGLPAGGGEQLREGEGEGAGGSERQLFYIQML